jgi:hypothetical protein
METRGFIAFASTSTPEDQKSVQTTISKKERKKKSVQLSSAPDLHINPDVFQT